MLVYAVCTNDVSMTMKVFSHGFSKLGLCLVVLFLVFRIPFSQSRRLGLGTQALSSNCHVSSETCESYSPE